MTRRETENRQRWKREKGGTRDWKRLNGCTAPGLHPAPALVSGAPPALPRPFVCPHLGDSRRGFTQRDHRPLLRRRRESLRAATAAPERRCRGVAEGQLGSTPKQVEYRADTDWEVLGSARNRYTWKMSTECEERDSQRQSGSSRDVVEGWRLSTSSSSSSFYPTRYKEQQVEL